MDGHTEIDDDFCYLTTKGRNSGRPHRIEIWYVRDGDQLFMLSGGRRASDWVRNIELEPGCDVQFGKTGAHLPVTARILDPDDPDDERARRLVFDKYQPRYDGDLTRWRERSLPVAFMLDT